MECLNIPSAHLHYLLFCVHFYLTPILMNLIGLGHPTIFTLILLVIVLFFPLLDLPISFTLCSCNDIWMCVRIWKLTVLMHQQNKLGYKFFSNLIVKYYQLRVLLIIQLYYTFQCSCFLTVFCSSGVMSPSSKFLQRLIICFVFIFPTFFFFFLILIPNYRNSCISSNASKFVLNNPSTSLPLFFITQYFDLLCIYF